MSRTNILESLLSLGYLFRVGGGIQIDINVVHKLGGQHKVEGPHCDHNCTAQVGGYDCPAARTLNPGRMGRYASADTILNWILTARDGLIQALYDFYFAEPFIQYCRDFQVPPEVATVIQQSVNNAPIEVNLFGGNPEIHPELPGIIATLRNKGLVVNLTTTGRRFMTQAAFTQAILQNPPNLIAVSVDDIVPDEFETLLALQPSELFTHWKQVPKDHGQQQKAIEALWMLASAKKLGLPQMLVNMVIHPGNLDRISQIIGALGEAFPGVLLNPYVAQSSFLNESNVFSVSHFEALDRIINLMITKTLAGDTTITKRLQYWLLLRAILKSKAIDHRAKAAMLSGNWGWKCFARPGANLYVQIGRNNHVEVQGNAEPGGHLGCYWNTNTVTQLLQIRSSTQVRSYVNKNTFTLAKEAGEHACRGCLMPRLMFSGPTTECGLAPMIKTDYLTERKFYMGF